MVRTIGKTADFVAVKDLGGAWLISFGREEVVSHVYEEDFDGNPVATGETKATELSTWYEEIFRTRKPTLECLTRLVEDKGLAKTSVKELYDVMSGLEYDEAQMLPYLKRYLKAKIAAYDSSSSVNSFTVDGKELWLPLEKRLGLTNSLPLEQSAGKTETSIWYDGEEIVIGIAAALSLLTQVETYASECYDQTQRHLAAAEELSAVSSVCDYDYTAGYPEKVVYVSEE